MHKDKGTPVTPCHFGEIDFDVGIGLSTFTTSLCPLLLIHPHGHVKIGGNTRFQILHKKLLY
jgi:hypothetical protein